MTDRIDIQDEYGNIARSIPVTADPGEPARWTLDQPTPLTDSECDRAVIHLEGRIPERLGRRANGDPTRVIKSLRFMPPTSFEAFEAARIGEQARATPRPVCDDS
jgi:hypothetical protein